MLHGKVRVNDAVTRFLATGARYTPDGTTGSGVRYPFLRFALGRKLRWAFCGYALPGQRVTGERTTLAVVERA